MKRETKSTPQLSSTKATVVLKTADITSSLLLSLPLSYNYYEYMIRIYSHRWHVSEIVGTMMKMLKIAPMITMLLHFSQASPPISISSFLLPLTLALYEMVVPSIHQPVLVCLPSSPIFRLSFFFHSIFLFSRCICLSVCKCVCICGKHLHATRPMLR